MTPAFTITADGQDATAAIADRLIALHVVDSDEERADKLTLEIDARDAGVVLPETDVPLDLELGFRETGLIEMGRFHVDGIGGEGPPLKVTVRATAANMVTGLRAPRSTAWENMTLGDIAATIAGRHGLRPAVAPALASILIRFEAQTAESDIAFMTRLARRFDATAKPAAGRLVLAKRDSGTAADGTALEPVDLDPLRLSSWDWDISERKSPGRVEAEWRDIDTGGRGTVTVGEGAPTTRLRHVHGTETEAREAAEAELACGQRGKIELNATLAGFEPALFAGGQVTLTGIYPGIDGVFLLRQVEHRLDRALTTSFRAEYSQGGGDQT